MNNKLRIWLRLMKLGGLWGCHQLPSRSFFIKGYQFPICARCVGMFIGYIIAALLYNYYLPSIHFVLYAFTIMLIDWGLQFLGILVSNNYRRVISGIFGGWGVMSLLIIVLTIN